MKLDLRDAKDLTGVAPLANPGPPLPPATPRAMVARQNETGGTLANVGEPLAGLCRKAEALCRQIAPLDLADLPIYIVPQSAIAGEFGNADAVYGYVLSQLDLILRDQIGSLWRGRGPCIVANDIAMREDLPGSIEAAFLSTVLHELAHVFERDMRFDAEPAVSAARLKFDGMVIANAVKSAVPEGQRTQVVHHHDQRFIRAMLHLRHRTEQLGARLVPSILFSSGATFVTAFDYLIALQDEPERRIDDSIRSILASPPPPAFTRLWADELEFVSRQSHSPKETK